MKYNQPPGTPEGSSYIDGNRSAGIKGSTVPAAAIELPQRELVHLIEYAGLEPSNVDLEQVRKAIQLLIAAATGGGETSDYALMSQLRARVPIYPEVKTDDGRINVSSPGAGQILVPPTVSCLHRGVYLFNTSDYGEIDRTFDTDPGKTYHLRWRASTGFALIDCADSDYNPGGLKAEADPSFDSTYDDMLVARVITNSSNVATITNLVNRHSLLYMEATPLVDAHQESSKNGALFTFSWAYNFARTPKVLLSSYGQRFQQQPANVSIDRDFDLEDPVVTRYGTKVTDAHNDFMFVWRLGLMAAA